MIVAPCAFCARRRPLRLVTEAGTRKMACDACLGLGKKRGAKFGNVRAGIPTPGGPKLYDSRLERDYAADLQLRAAAGDVRDVVEKPRLELFTGFFYKPDFAFVEAATGRRVWVDTKGAITQRYRDVVKAWRVFGPGPLLEVKRGRRDGFVVTREIQGGKAVAA